MQLSLIAAIMGYYIPQSILEGQASYPHLSQSIMQLQMFCLPFEKEIEKWTLIHQVDGQSDDGESPLFSTLPPQEIVFLVKFHSINFT